MVTPPFLVHIFFIFCFTPVILAQEFRGTRSVALSGALRGSISLNEGIYQNPAAFAFSRRYSIEAISSLLPANGKEKETAWIYGGSIIDAQNPFLSAGIGYYHKKRGADTNHVYHLSASKIFFNALSFGLTGKYIHMSNISNSNQVMDVDVGTLVVLTSNIQLGIVGHNVFAADDHFAREVGMGSRIKTWKFLYTNIDILKETQGALTKNISLLGAFEVVHENGVVFQGGVSLSDQTLRNLYSLGGGWSQHKFGLFYGFQNSMDGLARQTHALSMRVFF